MEQLKSIDASTPIGTRVVVIEEDERSYRLSVSSLRSVRIQKAAPKWSPDYDYTFVTVDDGSEHWAGSVFLLPEVTHG